MSVVAKKRGFDWINILFLTLTPLAVLVALPLYIAFNGVHWGEPLVFFLFYWIAGLGITMGYHRLFTHKTYEASPLVKFLLLVFGATAVQHSAYKWSSDHRNHHRYTDQESDPYNAKKGFWHSHILWVFYKEPETRSFENVSDLEKDPLVMWQHRNYVALAALGWLLPTAIGLAFGRPFGFFLWGGLVRTVFVHHSTFFVNSVAHIWGRQTYDDQLSARDSWWVALLSFGEGYHSFHHRFQADYRNGVRWFHWDPAKWIIWTGSHLGLMRNLRRSPDDVIIARRLEMDLKRAQTRLSGRVPHERWQAICKELEAARNELELKLATWKRAIHDYKALKSQSPSRARELRETWKAEIAAKRAAFCRAMQEWDEAIRFYLRQPQLALA